MRMPADAAEQRKLRSVARRYKRDGYRVTMPKRDGSVPAFLGGHVPDLIAESDGDRVVEVKRSDAVRGSNEILEVAERISREPGWRFGLVTVPRVEQASRWIDESVDLAESRTRQISAAGATDVAHVYALGFLDALVTDLALEHGLKVTKVPFLERVRSLVSGGFVSPEVLGEIERAHDVRNRLIHAERESFPKIEDVERLLALGRRVRDEMKEASMTDDAMNAGPVWLIRDDRPLGASAVGERDTIPGNYPRSFPYEDLKAAIAGYAEMPAWQRISVRGITDQSGRILLDRQGIEDRLREGSSQSGFRSPRLAETAPGLCFCEQISPFR